MRTVICAAFFLPSWALAAPADCISVEPDLDRLACYDKEAGRTPKAVPLPVILGKWRSQAETSKLTDQPTIVMALDSEEIIDCGWNRGEKISLVLRCMENKTTLYFSTGCHMTASDYSSYGDITYRLDDQKARTVAGAESTDNKALGLWSGGKSVPVIKQMIGKSRMVVRMTPYGESPFTATFDIAGLEAAVKPLREACKW